MIENRVVRAIYGGSDRLLAVHGRTVRFDSLSKCRFLPNVQNEGSSEPDYKTKVATGLDRRSGSKQLAIASSVTCVARHPDPRPRGDENAFHGLLLKPPLTLSFEKRAM